MSKNPQLRFRTVEQDKTHRQTIQAICDKAREEEAPEDYTPEERPAEAPKTIVMARDENRPAVTVVTVERHSDGLKRKYFVVPVTNDFHMFEGYQLQDGFEIPIGQPVKYRMLAVDELLMHFALL